MSTDTTAVITYNGPARFTSPLPHLAGARYTNHRILETEVITDSGMVSTFQCRTCDRTFPTYSGAFSHLGRSHGTPKPKTKAPAAPEMTVADRLADVLIDAVQENVREACRIAYEQGLAAADAAAADIIAARDEMKADLKAARSELASIKRVLRNVVA